MNLQQILHELKKYPDIDVNQLRKQGVRNAAQLQAVLEQRQAQEVLHNPKASWFTGANHIHTDQLG